ncbi:MAG TPA: 16S rRNA (guanine(966)-N(2))-methyltransferase RsmD [Ramlibacter sp.]|uniref:16S rRNA (guanine(966)-N(2))-methyltransferase RsmD n=1 Tax=Ramlibacter sp. TaxID=1917967 RepID=UPI002ED3E789
MPRTTTSPRRTNQVRIIGGQWKRTPLPVADRPGLRPTPDRVRETLFNWLGQDLSGWHCVDAFAGTGALGLEAASRGAADVLLVEAEGALVDQIRAIVRKLDAGNVRIQRGNALSVLASLPAGSVDLVFLDPPFESDLFDKALAAARPALKEGGFVYLEAPAAWEGEALARHGLEAVRYLKAGAVHGHLLRRTA